MLKLNQLLPSVYSYDYYLKQAKYWVKDDGYPNVPYRALKFLAYIQLQNEPIQSSFLRYQQLINYLNRPNHQQTNSDDIGMLFIDPSGEIQNQFDAAFVRKIIQKYIILIQNQLQQNYQIADMLLYKSIPNIKEMYLNQ